MEIYVKISFGIWNLDKYQFSLTKFRLYLKHLTLITTFKISNFLNYLVKNMFFKSFSYIKKSIEFIIYHILPPKFSKCFAKFGIV